MPNTYSAYAVSSGSTVLAGLTTLSAAINPEVEADVGIGSQFPQFAVIRAIKPTIGFASRSIASLLAVTGTTGAPITTDPLQAQFQTLTDGIPQSNAITYTLSKGLILPRRLSVSHRSDATLDVEALGRSDDGSTSPIALGSAASVTVPRDNIRHTLKSVVIAGITFDCLTDVSIDFGVNAETLGCDSHIYDSMIVKDRGITPSVSITTYDLAKLNQLTAIGKSGVHADSSIVLRQYDPSGLGFSTDADDITFTLNGIATIGDASGQGPSAARGTIRIDGSWDGTNSPIVLAA